MRICICGGGHLGHVCTGVLSSHEDVSLNIYSRNPSCWGTSITVTDLYNHEYVAKIDVISSDPKQAICDADIILLCLPGFAIETTLRSIKPHLKMNQIIGSIVSSTGFFFLAHEILGHNAKLFGFQRVPFISRVLDYGKSASLLGYKKEIKIAVENIEDKELFRQSIERLFLTPTVLLNNFYEACLTNSNPILHTGRLYSLWGHWSGETYERNIYFYKEWTDDASETILAMDAEFMNLVDRLPVDKRNIPSILDYYEVTDALSLTQKIRSISAFESIMAPMKLEEKGWIPDFGSRYFIEDFPYGLKYIIDLAQRNEISSTNLEKVYNWGIKCCGSIVR